MIKKHKFRTKFSVWISSTGCWSFGRRSWNGYVDGLVGHGKTAALAKLDYERKIEATK